jgi:hypothetical protein
VSIAISLILFAITITLLYLPLIQIAINPLSNLSDCQTEEVKTAEECNSILIQKNIIDLSSLFWIGGFPILDILDLTALSCIMLLILPAYYYRKDYNWRNKADEYLPNLLREISDAQKVGLPLPRAVIEAAKRQYGPLTEELHMMAAKISWGIPFSIGLRAMQSNIDTPLFDRTAVLILEAEKSGGETSSIFDSAYAHVTELLGLQRERLTAMSPYRWIIIVSFLVFSIVIIILLNTFFAQLAIQTAEISASGAESDEFGGIALPLFGLQILFFHLLIIEGMFAGLIAAKMSTGYIKGSGMFNSITLVVIAWVIFKIGALLL